MGKGAQEGGPIVRSPGKGNLPQERQSVITIQDLRVYNFARKDSLLCIKLAKKDSLLVCVFFRGVRDLLSQTIKNFRELVFSTLFTLCDNETTRKDSLFCSENSLNNEHERLSFPILSYPILQNFCKVFVAGESSQ